MALDTIEKIANHITQNFNNIPASVAGNMQEIVDLNRQHVANYTGETISSSSISAEFQPPIVNLSKADVIDFVQAQAGGEKLSLGELSVAETGEAQSSNFWRQLAEIQLKAIGMGIDHVRVLS